LRVTHTVAVAAGDDNLEVLTVLAVVSRTLSINGASPKSTTDVGGRWWVRAVRARSKSWVTLKVDVEAGAALVGVANSSASSGVVAVQVGVGDVRVTRVSGVQVLEDLLVAGRSLGTESSAAEGWGSGECLRGVWLRNWTGTQWLGVAVVVLWWRDGVLGWLWCWLGGNWWLAWLRLRWLRLGALPREEVAELVNWVPELGRLRRLWLGLEWVEWVPEGGVSLTLHAKLGWDTSSTGGGSSENTAQRSRDGGSVN